MIITISLAQISVIRNTNNTDDDDDDDEVTQSIADEVSALNKRSAARSASPDVMETAHEKPVIVDTGYISKPLSSFTSKIEDDKFKVRDFFTIFCASNFFSGECL